VRHTDSPVSSELFDVAVIGRGAAGCAAALTLRQNGLCVLQVGRSKDRDGHWGETLPAAARPILARLGALARFDADGHRACCTHQSGWGQAEILERWGMFDPHGDAVVLDRHRFIGSLEAHVRAAGVQVAVAEVRNVHHDGNLFRLELREPERCRWAAAKVVVDATGRSAGVARSLGASRTVWARQVSFGAIFKAPPEMTLPLITMVEARPNGWLYGAPLDARHAVVWWTTDLARGAKTRLGRQKQMLHEVESAPHVGRWMQLQRLLPIGKWASRDASVAGLNLVAGDGWVAVGDAALSLDPLSSSGVSAALLSGLHAGTALSAWLHGDGNALLSYTRMLERVRDDHWAQRRRFYSLESRWTGTEFWRLRQSAPSQVVDSNL
jgi:flavin-dependent dehydrogenase